MGLCPAMAAAAAAASRFRMTQRGFDDSRGGKAMAASDQRMDLTGSGGVPITTEELREQANQVHFSDTPRGFRLTTKQQFAHPIEEIFAFFADAENLEQITPPYLNFNILTPLPLKMRAGCVIDYRLRLRCVPIRWQSEITAWEPPHRFVDEQRRGPYRFWHHEHQFRQATNGTNVTDVVDYGVPLGFLLNRLVVSRDLRKIFAYRRAVLARRFPRQAER